MTRYKDWAGMNPFHRFAARELVRLMWTVEQIAVLRDASAEDFEAIAVVRDMGNRLAEELPK